MSDYNELVEYLINAIKSSDNINIADIINSSSERKIPLGISNRHVHLSQADLETLFGKDYSLEKLKDLVQPGQYACKEIVTICGPKGAIEKVRILGPVRTETQVEILRGDCFKLGVNAPMRQSADLEGSAPITIIGPKGSVYKSIGLIVAQRHIHMSVEDAEYFGVKDKDIVNIEFDSPRGGIYKNVLVRSNSQSRLECHLDTEEANAMDLNAKSEIKIIK